MLDGYPPLVAKLDLQQHRTTAVGDLTWNGMVHLVIVAAKKVRSVHLAEAKAAESSWNAGVHGNTRWTHYNDMEGQELMEKHCVDAREPG